MGHHTAFQKLFDVFDLQYGVDEFEKVHDAFISQNSVNQKQCGSLSLSIERLEKAIEDFDKPPLSFCQDKRERIQQLETCKRTAEQQLETVEQDMERLEKVLKDIEKLYKSYEPETYYSIHPKLNPVRHSVSTDLFKDADEIEDYTPEEIDGSNLVWSVPVVPPKQNSYNKFVCHHCHNGFSSKQKLQQHLRRKKRCTDRPIMTKQELDEMDFPKIKYVCNQCSKEYSNKTSLSRHKQTCTLHLKQSTQDALTDDGFVLSRFKHEKVEFGKESVLKRMMTNNYFHTGDINGARQIKTKAIKYSKLLVVEGVRNKFFRNPCNFAFYQPRVEHSKVMVYQGNRAKTKVVEIKVDELIDHMVQKVIDSLLDTIEDIRDFDTIDEDGAEVCTHELYKFLINYNNHDDDDVVSKRYFTNEVKLLLTEYKDDIKQIWKHMKLI